MKMPLFKITISYDDKLKLFIPEIQHTEASEKLTRCEQVEIIEQCVRVIVRAIRSTPKEGE